MPTIDLGPLGAVLSPAEAGFAATAGELERIGYSTIWLTGGPMDVAGAGRRRRAGDDDGHASPPGSSRSTRSRRPTSPRSTPSWRRRRRGASSSASVAPTAPIRWTTLNAYLDRLDGVVPRERRVMAALGPKMLQLARDRAAGAFPVLVTPDYVAPGPQRSSARHHARRRAARRARDRPGDGAGHCSRPARVPRPGAGVPGELPAHGVRRRRHRRARRRARGRAGRLGRRRGDRRPRRRAARRRRRPRRHQRRVARRPARRSTSGAPSPTAVGR